MILLIILLLLAAVAGARRASSCTSSYAIYPFECIDAETGEEFLSYGEDENGYHKTDPPAAWSMDDDDAPREEEEGIECTDDDVAKMPGDSIGESAYEEWGNGGGDDSEGCGLKRENPDWELSSGNGIPEWMSGNESDVDWEDFKYTF
jgi:hypothetical protein